MTTEAELAEIEALANDPDGIGRADHYYLLATKVPKLIAEIRRLREVLEFYACEHNWIEAKGEHLFDYFVSCDLGQRARKALKDD